MPVGYDNKGPKGGKEVGQDNKGVSGGRTIGTKAK